MKKKLIIITVAVMVGLFAGFAIPAFANGPQDGPQADQDGWQAMHDACGQGDGEAMSRAAEEVHGADFSSMPCNGVDYDESQGEVGTSGAGMMNGMGGHMSGDNMGGMMGGTY